ncbi:hypothetical protein DFA_06190 [Cavenderia fasciculata]|uniref:Uncharacterized protein n=1 Tax=Cavenderia fasciculata TaxID=261658 RepID=F4PKC8_CACFS|nr:uncharacterized protein DFA_06190 [Cavenderia fasciculata]EGG24052.1 hypothetical protein DFA_06190 [Cavenderia fasciculata]|eukprot:XP_004361903.1 hypothetical protein DFA_06190 [Cavenderia fasciculata]
MLFKNLSQLTPGAGKNIQKSSLLQGSKHSSSTDESTVARRGCCGGRRNRANNIDIDIDIDINIGNGNNWC